MVSWARPRQLAGSCQVLPPMHSALSTSLKAGTRCKGNEICISVLKKGTRTTTKKEATSPDPPPGPAAGKAGLNPPSTRPGRRFHRASSDPQPGMEEGDPGGSRNPIHSPSPARREAPGRRRGRDTPPPPSGEVASPAGAAPADRCPPAPPRPPGAHPASRMTLLSPQSQAPPAWLRNML